MLSRKPNIQWLRKAADLNTDSQPASPTLSVPSTIRRQGSNESLTASSSSLESDSSGLSSVPNIPIATATLKANAKPKPSTVRLVDPPSMAYPSSNTISTSNGGVEFPLESGSTEPKSRSSLKRCASVISLTSIPFAAQLERLTTLSTPLLDELDGITKFESGAQMCDAIIVAGAKIGKSIDTAKAILRELDADDDVQQSANCKDYIKDIEPTVSEFERFIDRYVEIIDEIQSRGDISNDILGDVVDMLEDTLGEWGRVKTLLEGVKKQVETAMEWEELRSNVIGVIAHELEDCQRMIFKMEEERHMGTQDEEEEAALDILALDAILDNTTIPAFPPTAGKSAQEVEERALIGLHAKMRPLRASLNFLPMRIHNFKLRGDQAFPTACEELDNKRNRLEKKWQQLERDADFLKREVGEDLWNGIFQETAKQAKRMLESLERHMNLAKGSIVEWQDRGEGQDEHLVKRLHNYHVRKTHYGPATEEHLSILEKSARVRTTYNGEIIRLQNDLKMRWSRLQDAIADFDQTLCDLHLDTKAAIDALTPANAKSNGHSINGSSNGVSSPGLRSNGFQATRPKAAMSSRVPRSSSPTSSTGSLYVPSQKTRSSISPSPYGLRTPTATGMRAASATGTRSQSRSQGRPRWNGSTKTEGLFGHNFKPLSLSNPTQYQKSTPPRRPPMAGVNTKIPVASPYSQQSSPTTPRSHTSMASSRRPSDSFVKSPSQKGSKIPTPAFKATPPKTTSYQQSPNLGVSQISGDHGRPKLRHQSSMSRLNLNFNTTRRASNDSTTSGRSTTASTTERSKYLRPATALGGSRTRPSIPARATTPGCKRLSMPPGAVNDDGKPRWRFR